jgi:serine/threonine-protein phosphatase 2A regulatory subunit B
VSDIVDLKPANMEELSEVITAAEFHPTDCNIFVHSSSKGIVRVCDMRAQALCDRHAQCRCCHGNIVMKLYVRINGTVS